MPCRLSAMQHSAPSWAGMSTGGFSVLAKSTICTCPEWVPGNANRELLLFGHSTQRPGGTHKEKTAHFILYFTMHVTKNIFMKTIELGTQHAKT